MSKSTIIALASGNLPAGIGILRVSGEACQNILDAVLVKSLNPSELRLRSIVDPADGAVIDRGMVLFSPGPNSFTGEDVIEFHLHGSIAIVKKLSSILLKFTDVRLAKAGEFTRQALENGKLDLAEVDGLGDLLLAETESQRVQALSRFEGGLSGEIIGWRKKLVDLLVIVEASLDFSDEEDVGDLDFMKLQSVLVHVKQSVSEKLDGYRYGRIVRDGMKILVAGLPNVGKSNLINALTRSNRLIVTDEAGTTRDIVDVRFDLNGHLITLLDSAGIRHSESLAESQGVSRTVEMLDLCDLVIWVSSPDISGSEDIPNFEVPFVHVSNKLDLRENPSVEILTSAKNGDVGDLMRFISNWIEDLRDSVGSNVISRLRDMEALELGLSSLERTSILLENASVSGGSDVELIAEEIRSAIFGLERMLGFVDSEEVLGKIFAGFCIGK